MRVPSSGPRTTVSVSRTCDGLGCQCYIIWGNFNWMSSFCLLPPSLHAASMLPSLPACFTKRTMTLCLTQRMDQNRARARLFHRLNTLSAKPPEKWHAVYPSCHYVRFPSIFSPAFYKGCHHHKTQSIPDITPVSQLLCGMKKLNLNSSFL